MKKIIAALLFVPCMAQAEFKNGNDLWNDLNGTLIEQSFAMGYITGVFDAHRGVHHCPPQNTGITIGQIQDMVKNYLAANPQYRNYTADIIVVTVFKKTWPCANQGKGV